MWLSVTPWERASLAASRAPEDWKVKPKTSLKPSKQERTPGCAFLVCGFPRTGKDQCLYGAIDSSGQTIDLLLTPNVTSAAKRWGLVGEGFTVQVCRLSLIAGFRNETPPVLSDSFEAI
jgi:hypothetical protein